MPERRELKTRAKADMRGKKPSIFLITLAFYAILLICELLTVRLAYPNISVQGIQRLVEYGDIDAIVESTSVFSSLLQTVIGFMTTVISVGFIICCLNLSRGMSAGFGELFDGFGMFFKVIGLSIMVNIFTVLWTMLFIIPGIIASYRYSMVYYILIDNPDIGIMECIRRSKEMMRGHKFEYFVLQFSFILWDFASAIPFVFLYVQPYEQVTYSNYYNALSGHRFGEDYCGDCGKSTQYDCYKDPWK